MCPCGPGVVGAYDKVSHTPGPHEYGEECRVFDEAQNAVGFGRHGKGFFEQTAAQGPEDALQGAKGAYPSAEETAEEDAEDHNEYKQENVGRFDAAQELSPRQEFEEGFKAAEGAEGVYRREAGEFLVEDCDGR